MAGPIRLTVDGVDREAAEGVPIGELLAPDAVVARVNGELRDLASQPADGDVVSGVPLTSPDGRAVLRHSTAHVLAQAVTDLFPGTRLGIGPPIENGFYYDFDVDRPFTPDDVARIEARMREIVAAGQRFRRRVVSEGEARAELADQPYKLELVGGVRDGGEEAVEVGGAELSMYDNVVDGRAVWSDLCRGPHLPDTARIPAFRLTRTAAAYWRGSEANPQLQRIYGTAWESERALSDHLALLAEAERRDHRRIGAELDLFSFPPEIGSGLVIFHPKGGAVRRAMEDYARRRHEEAGYAFVTSPHLAKDELFSVSGHLEWFAESMYPAMELEGSSYHVKPMNCPFHILVYRSRGRSYRELPMRLFEFGAVYRFEKSGVVHGLTRVRGMTQDDAHIFATHEQMAGELSAVLTFVLDLLRDFGLHDFYLELSTRPEGKAAGTEENWAEATEALRSAAEDQHLELVLDEGGGAFYGPKISVQARDAIGRSWQLSTIQVDYYLPERFGLSYQAADGSRRPPVMIHRALFGSVERFLGVLIEHYAGVFPAWLAPVQVVAVPVRADHVAHLESVVAKLREHGVRAEVDDSEERMQKKIRTAETQKVPIMLIAGDDDVSAGAVSFRFRDGDRRNGVPVDEAVAEVLAAVRGPGGRG